MESLVKIVISNWIPSLIIGAAGLFLTNIFVKLAIVLLGFYIGAYLLYPMSGEYSDFMKDVMKDPTKSQIAFWLFGGAGGLGLILLYNVFIFFVGALVSGAVVYFLYSYLDQSFNISQYITFMDPLYFKFAIVGIFGILGGLFAYLKEKQVSQWLGIGVGAAVLSISLIHVFNIFVRKMNSDESYNFIVSTTGLYIMLGLFIILISIGYLIVKKGNKRGG
ncbi:MAG: hypothetical protein J7L34_02760 [Thermotogaceae bacterium]|nr:hypothetical protein [Thermotogaceae bacterium]